MTKRAKETPTKKEAQPQPLVESQPIVERAFTLLNELDSIRQTAIEELLQRQEEIKEQLEKLGYKPAVPPKVAPTIAAPATRVSREQRVCKVCGQPGHDARKHRYEQAATSPPPENPNSSA